MWTSLDSGERGIISRGGAESCLVAAYAASMEIMCI